MGCEDMTDASSEDHQKEFLGSYVIMAQFIGLKGKKRSFLGMIK